MDSAKLIIKHHAEKYSLILTLALCGTIPGDVVWKLDMLPMMEDHGRHSITRSQDFK
jgi:hypothetical protein